MTEYVYPLSLAFFMDTLPIEKVSWDIVRYDEYDSQGTGHDMQSEMADPKWSAQLVFRELYNAEARTIAAKVRKLDGSALTFMVYDVSNPYPAADPGGAVLAGFTPQINTIGSNNTSITLKGLPAFYVLTIGDKGQINFGTDDVYFFEISETVTANGSGVTAAFEIWPHIPPGIVVNANVILSKPACKMAITPGGFKTGQASGILTRGVSIDALEHV